MWSTYQKQRKNWKIYAVTEYRFFYRNDLDKDCFQHDMAYGESKDLTKRTQADKVLRDKAFKIVNDAKYDGYQRGLALMVSSFLINV